MADAGNDSFDAAAREARRRTLGHACYLLGLISIPVTGAGLLWLFGAMDGRLDLVGLVSRSLLVVLLLLVTTALLVLAEGFLMPSARTVRARDRRPPVLYLRPFGEDRELTYDVVSTGESTVTVSAKAEDFLLALNALGPMVSIANPDRAARWGLHPLGVARDYVGDGDWQAHVTRWLDEAGTVVLAIGDSPGIEWEIAQVRARIGPQSLLLYLPPRPTAALTRKRREAKERALYEQFAPLVERHFGITMPPFRAATHLIGFDTAGRTMMAPDAPRPRWALTEHGRLSAVIRAQLEAVLAQTRPDADLGRFRIPGRAALRLRLGFAALVVLVVAALLVTALAGGGMPGASLAWPMGLLLQALPGTALTAGWVLLARHFRRPWVWSIPCLLALGVVAGILVRGALEFGWLGADPTVVRHWLVPLQYLVNAGHALAVLVLGIAVTAAPPAVHHDEG